MIATQLLLSLCSLLPVGDEPILELHELESPAGPDTRLPFLASAGSGALAMTWIADLGEGRAALRLSLLGAGDEGLAAGWSEPRTVVESAGLFLNWADFPGLALAEDGTVFMYWLVLDPRGGYHVEYVLGRGEDWTSPQRLHDDDSPVDHGFVSAVALAGGGFQAVWLDGRATLGAAGDGHGHGHGGEYRLYTRRIGAFGAPGPEVLLDPRACSCCQTDLAQGSGGELLAVYRDRSPQEVRDISWVLGRPGGGPWSKPRSLREDGWVIEGCPVNGPRLDLVEGAAGRAAAWYTGAGEGEVFVAWQGGGADDGWSPLRIDEGSPVGRVDLLCLRSDLALVSWLEYSPDDLEDEWCLRLVPRGAGVSGGALARVDLAGSGRDSGFLRMARHGDGAVLAWRTGGDRRHVACARLSLR